MQLRRHLFRIISRTAIALYSRFPIFGSLRASVGVLRKGDRVLVIDRADGRGLSFPGGFDGRKEDSEASVRREVREETGLRVTRIIPLFQYHTTADIPVNLSVFDIEAEGNLRGSWEGTPVWLPLAEIQSRLLPSQRPIVDRLLGS